ncbi:MAG: hypothetical protein J5876_03630 [Lachnospiraceae bacterium]|nr:hypothetical protein [Lachnospiraceae bacterium]MBO4461274.1 hypothetical protein [Lachnospiraceae bacterium]
MGVLETVLIIIGVLFVFASFFIPDRLTAKEAEKVSRLSEDQLKIIVDRKLKEAESTIDSTIDDRADLYAEKAERMLEKESNEKIMAISEYSDGVLEQINKAHKEIMFLYSMLNDKHSELITFANDLTSLKTDMENFSDRTNELLKEQALAAERAEAKEDDEVLMEMPEDIDISMVRNHNEMILDAYKAGQDEVDIARSLGLGIGEVRLVIDLYKGESKNEV